MSHILSMRWASLWLWMACGWHCFNPSPSPTWLQNTSVQLFLSPPSPWLQNDNWQALSPPTPAAKVLFLLPTIPWAPNAAFPPPPPSPFSDCKKQTWRWSCSFLPSSPPLTQQEAKRKPWAGKGGWRVVGSGSTTCHLAGLEGQRARVGLPSLLLFAAREGDGRKLTNPVTCCLEP